MHRDQNTSGVMIYQLKVPVRVKLRRKTGQKMFMNKKVNYPVIHVEVGSKKLMLTLDVTFMIKMGGFPCYVTSSPGLLGWMEIIQFQK